MCEITEQNTNYFREIFNFDANFPAEFVYGLLSNKWLLENLEIKLGIGANEKIEIIKELMRNERYQEYLGLEEFNDYIDTQNLLVMMLKILGIS